MRNVAFKIALCICMACLAFAENGSNKVPCSEIPDFVYRADTNSYVCWDSGFRWVAISKYFDKVMILDRRTGEFTEYLEYLCNSSCVIPSYRTIITIKDSDGFTDITETNGRIKEWAKSLRHRIDYTIEHPELTL